MQLLTNDARLMEKRMDMAIREGMLEYALDLSGVDYVGKSIKVSANIMCILFKFSTNCMANFGDVYGKSMEQMAQDYCKWKGLKSRTTFLTHKQV